MDKKLPPAKENKWPSSIIKDKILLLKIVNKKSVLDKKDKRLLAKIVDKKLPLETVDKELSLVTQDYNKLPLVIVKEKLISNGYLLL